jgi:hypothetical protein
MNSKSLSEATRICRCEMSRVHAKKTDKYASLCYLYVNNGLNSINSKYAVIQPIGKFKPVIINFINGYIGYLQMSSYSRKSDRIHDINYEK